MEDLLELSVLFEYYGNMLTPRQFDICDMYLNQNLSLGEISENLGITRQGVRDALVKSEKLLVKFEDNLKIMQKNEALSDIIASIEQIVSSSDVDNESKVKIIKLTNQISNLI